MAMNFPRLRGCDDHYYITHHLLLMLKMESRTVLSREQIDAVKQAEVLVLDDIGAEQFSSWIRDVMFASYPPASHD